MDDSMNLTEWDEVGRQIEASRDLKTLGQLHNKLDLMGQYVRQRKGALKVSNKATIYKIKVEMRVGKVYGGLKSERGDKRRDLKDSSGDLTNLTTKQQAEKAIGKHRETIKEWVKEAKIDNVDRTFLRKYELYCNRNDEEVTSKGFRSFASAQYRSDVQNDIPEEQVALPSKKFRVIYADPPWEYTGKPLSPWKYGDVQKEYPTMGIDDICALPVVDITAKNSVLLLWVTFPKLPWGIQVMDAWGFDYKTGAVWDKVKHNFGYYFSMRSELLLVGGKGRSTPDSSKLHDNVVVLERSSKHSEKPEHFRSLIDELWIPPKRGVNRIELFSRGTVPEWWESWGYESE